MSASNSLLMKCKCYYYDVPPEERITILMLSCSSYTDAEAVKIHLASPYMRELLDGEDAHGVKRGGNDIHHETLVAQIGPRSGLGQ